MRSLYRLFWLMMLGLVLLAACNSAPTATPAASQTPATVAPTEMGTQLPESSPTPTSEPLAALVDGEPITMAEYQRELAWYETSMAAGGQDPSTTEGQAMLAEARVHILEGMIEQTLIIQAAQQAGIVVSDDEVNAAIQSIVQEIGQGAFDQRLNSEGLTLDEARYQIWRSMMVGKIIDQVTLAVPTRAEHVRARHILVDTEAGAQQLLAQIQAGADFGALAQAYSQDPYTRDRGGDLGYFPRGILTSSEVEDAAFALQPGQVSGVVQSALGYHIIQVVDRAPDMEIDPDNLRLLRDSARDRWVADLWAQAHIERFVTP